jgi:hypothetical protein
VRQPRPVGGHAVRLSTARIAIVYS